jgi:hypothetical protein
VPLALAALALQGALIVLSIKPTCLDDYRGSGMAIEFIGSLVNGSAVNYGKIIKLVREQDPTLAGVGG